METTGNTELPSEVNNIDQQPWMIMKEQIDRHILALQKVATYQRRFNSVLQKNVNSMRKIDKKLKNLVINGQKLRENFAKQAHLPGSAEAPNLKLTPDQLLNQTTTAGNIACSKNVQGDMVKLDGDVAFLTKPQSLPIKQEQLPDLRKTTEEKVDALESSIKDNEKKPINEEKTTSESVLEKSSPDFQGSISMPNESERIKNITSENLTDGSNVEEAEEVEEVEVEKVEEIEAVDEVEEAKEIEEVEEVEQAGKVQEVQEVEKVEAEKVEEVKEVEAVEEVEEVEEVKEIEKVEEVKEQVNTFATLTLDSQVNSAENNASEELVPSTDRSFIANKPLHDFSVSSPASNSEDGPLNETKNADGWSLRGELEEEPEQEPEVKGNLAKVIVENLGKILDKEDAGKLETLDTENSAKINDSETDFIEDLNRENDDNIKATETEITTSSVTSPIPFPRKSRRGSKSKKVEEDKTEFSNNLSQSENKSEESNVKLFEAPNASQLESNNEAEEPPDVEQKELFVASDTTSISSLNSSVNSEKSTNAIIHPVSPTPITGSHKEHVFVNSSETVLQKSLNNRSSTTVCIEADENKTLGTGSPVSSTPTTPIESPTKSARDNFKSDSETVFLKSETKDNTSNDTSVEKIETIDSPVTPKSNESATLDGQLDPSLDEDDPNFYRPSNVRARWQRGSLTTSTPAPSSYKTKSVDEITKLQNQIHVKVKKIEPVTVTQEPAKPKFVWDVSVMKPDELETSKLTKKTQELRAKMCELSLRRNASSNPEEISELTKEIERIAAKI